MDRNAVLAFRQALDRVERWVVVVVAVLERFSHTERPKELFQGEKEV